MNGIRHTEHWASPNYFPACAGVTTRAHRLHKPTDQYQDRDSITGIFLAASTQMTPERARS